MACVPSEVRSANGAWPDRLGVWASVLCVVHCLVTPTLLSLSTVFVHFLPSEEKTHRALAVTISLLGCMALIRGFRRHRRLLIPLLMAGGLGCIFFGAFGGDGFSAHWQEVAVTFAGSVLMIAAHRLNHTFCRDCACAGG